LRGTASGLARVVGRENRVGWWWLGKSAGSGRHTLDANQHQWAAYRAASRVELFSR
jgi:hypothetical protein